MAGKKKPGPTCFHRDKPNLRDGTLCLQASPKPGPQGLQERTDQSLVSGWRETAAGWSSSLGNWFDSTGERASGHSKSLLLSLVDKIPFKQDSPFSTALLKHYVERSGAPYELTDIPPAWQDWIVKATGGRRGMHRDMNPYNSGLFDLRNSLGHFDVEVKTNFDKTRTYLISDVYQFGFTPNDKNQRGRHGFPLGDLNDWELAAAKSLLPGSEYANPGGFREPWEIRRVGQETILFIPQQFLADQGKPFKVSGSFTR